MKVAKRFKIDGEVVSEREFNRRSRAKKGAPMSSKAWNSPLLSDAMGVHPSDIRAASEHDARHGVPTSYTPDGRAIYTSALHRKRHCELHGFFDRNASYGDPQPKRL